MSTSFIEKSIRYFDKFSRVRRRVNEILGEVVPVSYRRIKEAAESLQDHGVAHLLFRGKSYKMDVSHMLYFRTDKEGNIDASVVPGVHVVTGNQRRTDHLEDFFGILQNGFRGSDDPNVILLSDDWQREVVEWGNSSFPDEEHKLIKYPSQNPLTEGDSMRLVLWEGFWNYHHSAWVDDMEYKNMEYVGSCEVEDLMGVVILAEDADIEQRIDIYQAMYEEAITHGYVAPLSIHSQDGYLVWSSDELVDGIR